MTLAVLKRKKKPTTGALVVGPESNGMLMAPRDFDRADFEEGWRYELINGVLIVSPIPFESERDPNEELGRWLRNYKEYHPQGSCLDKTLWEHTIRTGSNRRRADRCIWVGLGRLPKRYERPTIVAEFVSSGTRNRIRDYETKRDEYMAIKVKEYWVFDRFDRCMAVFTRQAGKIRLRIYPENHVYTTPLLPGFELPIAKLLALADSWAGQEGEMD